MNENSATPAAIPIAEYRLPPEALNAPKLALVTKNQPGRRRQAQRAGLALVPR